MPENDDEDRPRPRRSENDDDRAERPRRRRDEDDYEEPGDRRARRGRGGDATGGLIPYKNAKALASYYCGVFALIPCLGAILGPIALILGFMGLSYANKMPEAKGKAHAIVGIVLGGLVTLAHIAAVALMGLGAAGR